MQLVPNRLNYRAPWALPDVYLFTGNPIRRKDGAVVMGRGAAKEVRDAWPKVQYNIPTDKPVTFYEIAAEQFIGWFQVKRHWAEDADLTLIATSAEHLTDIALKRSNNKFHINAPGVGNGRLRWEDVEPLLSILPDNVLVYR